PFGNFVALILLVVAYFLFGVPLTARLWKIRRRKRVDSPPSSCATMISPLRFYRMSPRRQDSQDTLFEESVNGGDENDKLDCRLPLFFFFTFRPEAVSHFSTHDSDVHHRSEGMP